MSGTRLSVRVQGICCRKRKVCVTCDSISRLSVSVNEPLRMESFTTSSSRKNGRISREIGLS